MADNHFSAPKGTHKDETAGATVHPGMDFSEEDGHREQEQHNQMAKEHFGRTFDEQLNCMADAMPVKMEFSGIRFAKEEMYVVTTDERVGRTIGRILTAMTMVEFQDGTIGFLGQESLARIMSADELDAYTAAKAEEDELRRNGAGLDDQHDRR